MAAEHAPFGTSAIRDDPHGKSPRKRYCSGMKKALAGAAIATALLLTACAGGGDQAAAHNGCVDDAKAQLPSSAEQINTSKLETTNMSDTFKELADNPLPDDPDAAVLWTTVGDIWYREDGKDRSASVLCLVTFENGQPTEPIEATLTFG